MSSWPERKPTASARLPIGIDVEPLDDGGLGGVGRGDEQAVAPLGGGRRAIARTPLIGRVSPVSASSPTTAKLPRPLEGDLAAAQRAAPARSAGRSRRRPS